MGHEEEGGPSPPLPDDPVPPLPAEPAPPLPSEAQPPLPDVHIASNGHVPAPMDADGPAPPHAAAAGGAGAGPGSSKAAAADAGGWTGSDAGPSSAKVNDGAASAAEAAAEASRSAAEEEALLKEFFGEMKDVDRDNEVNRILWSFKLNPYERLNLRFTATPEEVRRQFRKLSLMVHPDKCGHPQAAEAFDILGAAQKELLDEERRAEVWQVLDAAREELRKEREKETKHDTTIELAALLHERGKEGVREAYEATDDFHEKWRVKARDMLARSEFRRRRLVKRLKEETERSKEEHAEMKQQFKKQKEHEKAWESSRDTRVGTWRDYLKGGAAKKASKHLKPPKQKTWDEEKTYVQRPAGEQHRPPPPKPAGPKKA